MPSAIQLRAVIDTSTLVPFELRRELQEAAQVGHFTAIWSPWIIAELNRVLTWQWIKRPPYGLAQNDLSAANERRCSAAAKQMMTHLLPVFEVVLPLPPYPPAWPELTDRWDEPIWAAAVVGGAQYVISENIHDFPPRQPDGRHGYQGIEYLRGGDFLDRLTQALL